MSTYLGTASWFKCGGACCGYPGTNNGACGDCCADDPGVAWPYIGSINYASCFAINQLSCGSSIDITNLCSGTSMNVAIVDHGPGAACTVVNSGACSAAPGSYERLIDLTVYAFDALGGDLHVGWFPVEVNDGV